MLSLGGPTFKKKTLEVGGFSDGTVVHWFACGIEELFIVQMRSAAICECTAVHFFYKNTPEKLGHVLKIVFFPIAKKGVK